MIKIGIKNIVQNSLINVTGWIQYKLIKKIEVINIEFIKRKNGVIV